MDTREAAMVLCLPDRAVGLVIGKSGTTVSHEGERGKGPCVSCPALPAPLFHVRCSFCCVLFTLFQLTRPASFSFPCVCARHVSRFITLGPLVCVRVTCRASLPWGQVKRIRKDSGLKDLRVMQGASCGDLGVGVDAAALVLAGTVQVRRRAWKSLGTSQAKGECLVLALTVQRCLMEKFSAQKAPGT